MSGVETVGERLKRLRQERGLSQRSIASPGVSHAYISRIEAGTRVPSVKALRMLAGRLGVSPEYLETGVDVLPREALELRLADAELELRLGTGMPAGLTELAEQAESLADAQLLGRALALAGLAAARAGEQRTAVSFLRRATEEASLDPTEHADVYITLGTAYVALDEPQNAIALYERCLDEVIANDADDSNRIRYATHLSYALADSGQIDRAAEVLDAVVDAPTDAYSRVRVQWSLARLTVMQGRDRTALRHMQAAIALLEATEDSLHLARAQLMCAEIYVWAGEDERAQPHIEHAEALVRLAEPHDAGALRALQAVVAARAGELDEAERHVLAALQLIGDSGFGRPLACLALVLVHAKRGALTDARHAFEDGIASLEAAGMGAQVGPFCAAWADALDEAGEHVEATAVRARAVELQRSLERVST